MLFFGALVQYCIEHGGYDEERGQYFAKLSFNEMARTLCCNKPQVVACLKLFADCGAIVRTQDPERVHGTCAYITYINL